MMFSNVERKLYFSGEVSLTRVDTVEPIEHTNVCVQRDVLLYCTPCWIDLHYTT